MAKKPTPLVTPSSIIEDQGGCVVFAETLGFDMAARRGERRVNNWKRAGIPMHTWPTIVDKTMMTGKPVSYEMLHEAERNLKARVA